MSKPRRDAPAPRKATPEDEDAIVREGVADILMIASRRLRGGRLSLREAGSVAGAVETLTRELVVAIDTPPGAPR